MSSKRYARSFAPKVSIVLALPLLTLSGGAALADAIDGDWCHGDGRRLSINGPDIVTPGGAHLKGDYDRHHFAYVVPSSEPGAGATVTMVLLSEILMHLKPPPEVEFKTYSPGTGVITEANGGVHLDRCSRRQAKNRPGVAAASRSVDHAKDI